MSTLTIFSSVEFSLTTCLWPTTQMENGKGDIGELQVEVIADKKAKMEEFLLNQDWDERAKTMLERKDEWHKLGFFEQSDWKTKFFGIEKERFKMVLWK